MKRLYWISNPDFMGLGAARTHLDTTSSFTYLPQYVGSYHSRASLTYYVD